MVTLFRQFFTVSEQTRMGHFQLTIHSSMCCRYWGTRGKRRHYDLPSSNTTLYHGKQSFVLVSNGFSLPNFYTSCFVIKLNGRQTSFNVDPSVLMTNWAAVKPLSTNSNSNFCPEEGL